MSVRYDLLTRAWSYFLQRAPVWATASLLAWGGESALYHVLWRFGPHALPLWYLVVAFLTGIVHRTCLTGLCRIALNQLRGEAVHVRALLTPRSGLARTAGIMTAVTAAELAAYQLGLLFGVVLSTLLLLLPPLLADRRLRLAEAVTLSGRTILTELPTAVCFVVALGFFPSLVLAVPIVPIALALLYRTLFPYTRTDAVE